MPVWHAATKQLVADGKLVVLGVIQEQHAERARLYAQWKSFDFPILQDAMTRNGLGAVPVPIFIDEHGVVRSTRPRPDQIDKLVATEFDKPGTFATPIDREGAQIEPLADLAATENSISAWTNLGDANLMWDENSESTTAAIQAYETAIALKPTGYIAASLQFRLGVAYRARCDSDSRRDDDFRLAVQHWTAAIDANPNQYIWRRRIQQYGPRQTKPYPFYDWVEQAVADIKLRGEKPIELTVPLSGSEVATRQQQFQTSDSDMKNPDPNGRLFLDDGGFVNVRTAVVPSNVKPGETVRVHVLFEPGSGKWNNEGQPMQVWLNAARAGKLSKSAFELDNASEANSTETRRIEFEYQTPSDVVGPIELSGFAVYNVCVDVDATCRFLRKDFAIAIGIKE